MADFSAFHLKELDKLLNYGGYTPLIANSNSEFQQFFMRLGIDVYEEYNAGSKAKTLMNFWEKSSNTEALKVIKAIKEIALYEFDEQSQEWNKMNKLFISIEDTLNSNLNIDSGGTFEKNKRYKVIKELTPGGFGDTFLIEDIDLKRNFVLKKFRGEFVDVNDNKKFLSKFIEEIQMLYDLNHINIVRIYDYGNDKTAWYIMEYIDGFNIDEYVSHNKMNITKIFLQMINVFSFLESRNICHRDIRVNNILVSKDGILKIIDFGFGKIIENAGTLKSATKMINYPFVLPNELNSKDPKYNGKTEIYFVGKLFEYLLEKHNIDTFQYKNIIDKMIVSDPINRIPSFVKIKTMVREISNTNDIVSKSLKENYQSLITYLNNVIVSRSEKSKLYTYEEIIANLEELKEKNLLSDKLENVKDFAECFVSDLGEYYTARQEITLAYIVEMISWLKKLNNSEQKQFIKNLHYKLLNYNIYNDYDLPF